MQLRSEDFIPHIETVAYALDDEAVLNSGDPIAPAANPTEHDIVWLNARLAQLERQISLMGVYLDFVCAKLDVKMGPRSGN